MGHLFGPSWHGKADSELHNSLTPFEEDADEDFDEEGALGKRKRVFEDGIDDEEDEEEEDEFHEESDMVEKPGAGESGDEEMYPENDNSSAQSQPFSKPFADKKKKKDLGKYSLLSSESNSTGKADIFSGAPNCFKLDFSVPVNGADEVVSLVSSISWSEFCGELADALGIAPKAVYVAYHFSTDARTAHYLHLKNSETLTELFWKVKKTIKSTRSKKPFFIEIKDLREDQEKKPKTSKSSKGKKKVWNS